MYSDTQWKEAVRRLSHALFLEDYSRNFPKGDKDHRKEMWSDNRGRFNSQAKRVLKELLHYNYVLADSPKAQAVAEDQELLDQAETAPRRGLFRKA